MFIMLHFYIIMLHYANALCECIMRMHYANALCECFMMNTILLKIALVYVIPQVPVFFVVAKNKSIVSVIL